MVRRVIGALSDGSVLPGAGACDIACGASLELEALRYSVLILRIFEAGDCSRSKSEPIPGNFVEWRLPVPLCLHEKLSEEPVTCEVLNANAALHVVSFPGAPKFDGGS